MNTFTTKSTPLLGGSGDNIRGPSDQASPSTGLDLRPTTKRELTQLENFAVSALAPSIAVLFTNPFDTVKVRLQLQGEFVKTREPGRNGKEVVRVSEKVKHARSAQAALFLQVFAHSLLHSADQACGMIKRSRRAAGPN